MVRPSSSIGRKWERNIQESVSDAVAAYERKLPEMAQGVIDAKQQSIANFTASLNDPSYNQRVRAGLSVGKADVAYSERMLQIVDGGFTASQRDKQESATDIRRHVSDLIPGIIDTLDTDVGSLVVPAGISDKLTIQIVNGALMKKIENFSTDSSIAQVLAILKGSVGSLPNLSLKV